MKNNLISDFNEGEIVYHRSNPKILMVAVSRDELKDQIICRWVDVSGKVNIDSFLPLELEKNANKSLADFESATLVKRKSHLRNIG